MFEKSAAAFLFDMDGTLIDSIAAAERIWGRWAARQGLDVARFLPTIHGARAIDTVGRLALPGLDPAVEAKRIEAEEIEDLDGVVPIPGAARFLAALPKHRWTIVTSAPFALAAARLAKAGIPQPETMVSGEHIAAGKPAPDCYWLGAERLGFPIADCLVFEDAPIGIAAAEASGADLIVVGAAGHAPAGRVAIADYDRLELAVEATGLRLRSR